MSEIELEQIEYLTDWLSGRSMVTEWTRGW